MIPSERPKIGPQAAPVLGFSQNSKTGLSKISFKGVPQWPGRPWTTSPSPWTAGTACGCTLAAHRLGRVAHRRPTTGGTPPEPPAALRAAQLFEISQKPENRQGLGVGHGQPQAVAHPRHRRTRARNPSGWVAEAAGARCAKARQGAQPWGSGGASPLPGSALGAAGTAQAKRAGGPWTPPFGGLFTPKGRTTLL